MKIFQHLKLKILLLLCAMHCQVYAYELATHSTLTRQAASQSLLTSSSTIKRLGILEMPEPLGKTYYDFLGNLVIARPVTQFEGDIIERTGENKLLSIRAWLMRGAIREDDGASDKVSYLIYVDPDPYGLSGGRNRYCNHFLDPITRNAYSPPLSEPLSILFCPSNYNAPNWAIGTSDAFAASPVEESGFRNHFSIFNAREAMWRALTPACKSNVTRRDNDA